MGFDLFGCAPKAKGGEYFRNNVWWWRPLWAYVCDVCTDILTEEDRTGGAFNDGHVIGEAKARAIHSRLTQLLENGAVASYAERRARELAALPDEDCTICAATGKRKNPPETGAGNEPCNGCSGTGKVPPWDKHYPFDVDNVREFAAFLEECGGFEVC